MDISNRARSIQASPIRKLKPFADSAKAKGIKIFHLNIGDPDVLTPAVAIKAYNNYEGPVLGYGPAQGFIELRQAVARYFGNYNIALKADEVLITNGGSEAIQFAFSVIGDAGDEVIIPEPYYTNYNSYATSAGLKIVPLPLKLEDGFALPDISAMEALITPRTKAIMLCSPNNPTGTVYSPGELDAVAALVKKHDLFLIGDEVYKEFIYDGLKHKSILEYPEISSQVIVIDSISKRYSCCGARIGMLLTRNVDVYQSALKFAQARLCPPTVDQYAALAAYGLPMSYFQATKDEYQKRRDVLVDGLQTIPGVVVRKPQGAFYVIARLPVKDSEHFARWMLEDFSYEGKTVMVAPAPGFYATASQGLSEVRLAYVINCDELKQALVVFRKGIEKYQQLFG